MLRGLSHEATRHQDALDEEGKRLQEVRKGLLAGHAAETDTAKKAELKAALDANLNQFRDRLLTKGLGAQYADEDKKFGWRANIKPSKRAGESQEEFEARLALLDANREQVRETTGRVTKMFDEREREAAKLGVAPDGAVQGRIGVGPAGTVAGAVGSMDKLKRGYVIGSDAEAYQFAEGKSEIVKVTDAHTGEEAVRTRAKITCRVIGCSGGGSRSSIPRGTRSV